MRDKWPVSGGRFPLAKGMLLPVYVKAQSKPQNVTTTDNQLLLIKNLLTVNSSNSIGYSDYGPRSPARGCRGATCSPAGRRDVAPLDGRGHRGGPVRHAELA